MNGAWTVYNQLSETTFKVSHIFKHSFARTARHCSQLQASLPSARTPAGRIHLCHYLQRSHATRQYHVAATSFRMASTNSPLFAGLPPLPHVPGTEPERIALDAFRIAIADQVARSLNLDIAKVYEGVQYGPKGSDCNLAIPRFRLKEDAKVLAKKVADEVSSANRKSHVLLNLKILTRTSHLRQHSLYPTSTSLPLKLHPINPSSHSTSIRQPFLDLSYIRLTSSTISRLLKMHQRLAPKRRRMEQKSPNQQLHPRQPHLPPHRSLVSIVDMVQIQED